VGHETILKYAPPIGADYAPGRAAASAQDILIIAVSGDRAAPFAMVVCFRPSLMDVTSRGFTDDESTCRRLSVAV
jgi:hypothetical protein